MILDRTYQLELLTQLSECYPSPLYSVETDTEMNADEKHRYVANMCYLEEHGLVDSGIHKSVDNIYSLSEATITAKGMDFLLDDGGLSAILGTVTIKIHDDTLKQIIMLRIENSELEQQDKNRWSAALQSLPAETTKHLTMKLLDLGLTRAPEALHVIETYLGKFL